ncbi:hypothetical protein GCM10011367_25870 [Marinicauda pacifica]|uniref:SLATT domain-containing protein n=1 Tax=Marinicauda pacifica TaxID=1133559 RepID=A0A4S2H9P3_9PROT|nr:MULTISPECIES: hypothetical protein [Marinicauda]TGY92546.1 hypothetical protein E5162_13005 [Marinicauda pacifica]GGE49809.1 hypothetical protein GCM10011367_25870 [Marinicauda pacifica]
MDKGQKLALLKSDFLQHRQTLLSLLAEQERSFDKAITLLSGGAVAVVISLAEIFGRFSPVIYFAVGCFVVTLLANLLSYLASSQLKKAEINQWDEDYLRRKAEIDDGQFDDTKERRAISQCKFYSITTNLLNLASLGAVILGLILAIWGFSAQAENLSATTHNEDSEVN